MSNFYDRKNYWKPCQPGTILSVVDSNFQRDRRRFLIRSAMGVVLAGSGLFSTVFVLLHGKGRDAAKRESAFSETGANAATVSSRPTSSYTVESRQATAGGVESRKTSRAAAAREQEYDMLATRFTCREINDQLDHYLVAFRKLPSSRSNRQRQLVRGFEQHLVYCPECRVKVEVALRDV
jgi:hypothetical protein